MDPREPLKGGWVSLKAGLTTGQRKKSFTVYEIYNYLSILSVRKVIGINAGSLCVI
jgi:hypothetical protein